MTKHECAVITAYTGISLLRGTDLSYLYKYLSGIIGRPIFTHEIPAVVAQYKDSIIRHDFCTICQEATDDS
jgi:hypothetical protein